MLAHLGETTGDIRWAESFSCPIMPLSFFRNLLYILLLGHYSFALDSDGFYGPLNGLDATPPTSFSTAENGITGNFIAASNIGLTKELTTDPQASDLFNSQAMPDTLSQLNEANSNLCVPKTDMSPNRRRRSKRGQQCRDSNLFIAPGATAPTGSRYHESGQQHTDESSRREAGKKPSASAQDEKKEPSTDASASPNNKSPCYNKEFIHALCGPMSALWQITSLDSQRSRLMLGAANICMLLVSFHFTFISSFTKTKKLFLGSIRSEVDRCAGFPPGCLEPDLAWCCKTVAPVCLIFFSPPHTQQRKPNYRSESAVKHPTGWFNLDEIQRSVVLPTFEDYFLVGSECLPQELLNFLRKTSNFK